jgi:hypothetical protein
MTYKGKRILNSAVLYVERKVVFCQANYTCKGWEPVSKLSGLCANFLSKDTTRLLHEKCEEDSIFLTLMESFQTSQQVGNPITKESDRHTSVDPQI